MGRTRCCNVILGWGTIHLVCAHVGKSCSSIHIWWWIFVHKPLHAHISTWVAVSIGNVLALLCCSLLSRLCLLHPCLVCSLAFAALSLWVRTILQERGPLRNSPFGFGAKNWDPRLRIPGLRLEPATRSDAEETSNRNTGTGKSKLVPWTSGAKVRSILFGSVNRRSVGGRGVWSEWGSRFRGTSHKCSVSFSFLL